MIRLSANLGFMWPELTLLQRVEAAGRAGFTAIELHWPYDTPASELKSTLDQAGIRLLGINTPVGSVAAGEFGLAALPGREDEFAAAFQRAIIYCTAAGGSAVHAMAGVVTDDPASAATLVSNLKSAVPIAAAAGVTILLEAINPRDKPGYFYHRVERAAEIIDAVGSDRVRLMFDAYHVGVGQGDVLRRLDAMMPVIGHIQIAAVPSRAEPDEGELNFQAVFEAIEASGYSGWVGCEYRPRGNTDDGLIWRQRFSGRRFK